MDALRATARLSRTIITLAEANRSGALRIRSGGRGATLWLSSGELVAVDGVDGTLLGDALMQRGALDTVRHREALGGRPPEGRVGSWLIEVGAASQAEVRAALRAQLYERVATVLRWPSPSFSFSADVLRTGEAGAHADPVVAVWDGLLQVAHRLTQEERAGLSGRCALRFTGLGELLSTALAKQGRALPDGCLSRASGSEAERAVLRTLHAAVDERVDAESYSLLLRKRREIRRMATPSALLDLPAASGPEAAKRALRRLAQKLHPDRFAASDPRLRGVSNDVLRALLHAEATLRASR